MTTSNPNLSMNSCKPSSNQTLGPFFAGTRLGHLQKKKQPESQLSNPQGRPTSNPAHIRLRCYFGVRPPPPNSMQEQHVGGGLKQNPQNTGTYQPHAHCMTIKPEANNDRRTTPPPYHPSYIASIDASPEQVKWPKE